MPVRSKAKTDAQVRAANPTEPSQTTTVSLPSEDALKRTIMAGDGEMASLMRQHDWSQTPLGPVSGWPQSLRTAVSLILNSQHPMWIGWGPQAIFLYNDAYIRVLSLAKHPWALGRPAAEVWAEIWDVCGPLADKVFQKGEPSFFDDVCLFMNRGDYLEETYYSFSYSPIRDETGGVGGLFCPSAEVTSKVLNARRLRTLSELSADAFVERSVENACASAMRTLAKNADDTPFALLYLVTTGEEMRLQSAAGVAEGDWAQTLPLLQAGLQGIAEESSSTPETLSGEQVISVAHLESLPRGPARQKVAGGDRVAGEAAYRRSCHRNSNRRNQSHLRKLDGDYRTFYQLVASHVATAIANARAYQEERKRAQVLAELDKAKTIFFSNISHEFRTPLTLMLGPIESALARPALSPEERTDFELLHRNALRLLKLVNALLDFSRLEAGRIGAHYEPVNLPELTGDLVSVFPIRC